MELNFEKWEDGKWFVVLPDYDGDQEDLEMVDGADKLLDILTTDGLYVNLNISLEEVPGMFHLQLVKHDEIGGTYEVTNHGRFLNKDIWLCNVVHYLLGEHPEEIPSSPAGNTEECRGKSPRDK